MCTSQYHHCGHESDIQGSKYPMRWSETHTPERSGGTNDGEVRGYPTFVRRLPVRRKGCVVRTYTNRGDSTWESCQSKIWREYVPRRGGISFLCHWRIMLATGVSPIVLGIYLRHDGRLVNGELWIVCAVVYPLRLVEISVVYLHVLHSFITIG